MLERLQCRIRKQRPSQSPCIIFLFIVAISYGCALNIENTAFFKEDSELTYRFESAQILTDYQYYYSGPEAEPFAILGIRRDYQFEKGLWKKIDLTESQLKRWMDRIDNPHREARHRYYGSYIVDRGGDRVGIWYALTTRVTTIIKPEEKWITVHIPDQTKFIDHGGRKKTRQPRHPDL